jgi:hypothetical protein
MTTQTAEQSLTHHARLVLDNDYGLYTHRLELVAQSRESAAEWETTYELKDNDGAVRVSYLADALKDWAEEIVAQESDDVANGFTAEILTTALAWIDWQEMARDYIAEEAESA